MYPTPQLKGNLGKKKSRFGEEEEPFFYSADMWAIHVIEMVKNLELCQIFFDITDPQWSCVDLQL
jgi:hypothetical protein